MDHGKTFTFYKKPTEQIKYVVESSHSISEKDAMIAFTNYCKNHLISPAPGEVREVKIRFVEWFNPKH